MTAIDADLLPSTVTAGTASPRLDLEPAAIGAAVGAGCRPCLTHHLGVAREHGMEDDRLRWVLATAEQSRSVARDGFGRHAAQLLGDDVPREHRDQPADGPLSTLVALGVAVGANAVELARAHLDHLAALGIGESDRKRAVNMARAVQRTAGELTASELATDDPDAPEADVAAAGPCCGEPSPAAVADSNETSTAGCCG